MARFHLAAACAVVLALFGQQPALGQPGAPDLKPLEVPSQCAKKDKVRIANTGHVLIYVAGQYAKATGIFDRLCLDVEMVTLNAQVEGLIGRQVDFIESNTMEPVKTHAAGRHLLAVAPMLACYTNSFVVRKEVVDRFKLTRESPLKDRLAALKGLRIGVTNLSQGAGLWVLLMLDEAGLSAKDVKLNQLDNAPGMMAAFRTGQIDALSSGSPPGEQLESEGLGYRLITGPGGDFPGFGPDSRFPYTSIMTTRQFALDNPELVQRVVAGFMWANARVQSERQTVRDSTRKTMFPKLNEKVFDQAFDFTYPCFAQPDDRFTQASFDRVLRVANLGRKAGGLPPVTRIRMDDIMTNRFLDSVASAAKTIKP
jgi:NitT/TauT family transport system substrate-binding protein